MKKVTVYSDGACSPNPGPGGYGTILIYGKHRKEMSGNSENTTNNRMEILGVIKGLEALKEPCEVDVFSDSKYVVDAINKNWIISWQKKNWLMDKTTPRPNVDLWKILLELLAKHKVTFHWVKGHDGNIENERCDELAREAIKKLEG